MEMNILIIRHNTWDDSRAGGNTLSNLFTDWPNSNFAYLYSRNTTPNNNVCSHYYRITEINILKYFFNSKAIGEEFYFNLGSSLDDDRKLNSREKKVESVIKKILNVCNLGILHLGADLLWKTKKWKNTKFEKFIRDFSPDIIFAYASDFVRLQCLLETIRKLTNARITLFFADDVFGYKHPGIFNAIHRTLVNASVHRCIEVATICYGITEQLCSEYSRKYNKAFYLLQKGCDLSETLPRICNNNPISLIYAGNLYYGRDQTLIHLIQAMQKLNESTSLPKVSLNIYCNSEIPKCLNKLLLTVNFVKLNIKRPYSEVMASIKNADIVLHIESFSEKARRQTRLSFSTKITDCMQSGACLLAIGPDEIASMEYVMRLPGVFVINDVNKIYDILKVIADDPLDLLVRAKQLNQFALEHHEIQKIRVHLQEQLWRLVEVSPFPE